jgi:predicted cupin superfamily sugar epimerase
MDAEELIKLLNLKPHPKEGGYFRETYRAGETWPSAALPKRYSSERSAGTAIYYLLTPTTFSAMHRLQSDEIFHFYLGSSVRMLQLFPDGTGRTVVLGPDLRAEQQLQVVVPRGTWQGSFLDPGGDFALLGCTVAPGFEYADYEGTKRSTLIPDYPEFADLIGRLTSAD